MQIRDSAVLVAGTILCVLCLPFALMFAGFSVMESDGGVTPEARTIFYVMCGWPVSAVAGPIVAWVTRARLGHWALLFLLPCLVYAVVIHRNDSDRRLANINNLTHAS